MLPILSRLGVAAALALSLAAPALAGSAGQDRLAGLPLSEIPTAMPGDTLAVLYSGDGGWAAIDKGIAAELAKSGVPTVGVNSLRYFWTARTPQGAAADLAAMIEHYQAAWGRRRVLLVGYSFGADALPIIVANLPPELRSQVSLLALVGTDPEGELKFHLGDLVNRNAHDAYALAPVLEGLKGMRMACIYADGETGDACTSFPPAVIRQIRMAGGHHFGGAYDRLGQTILAAARP